MEEKLKHLAVIMDGNGRWAEAHGRPRLEGHRAGAETAGRVVKAILREERNARIRLFEELPRVFGDSLCRALAVLKNCRLLSPGECFDLLSPLRLPSSV